jgi:uncharacterized protein YkwD
MRPLTLLLAVGLVLVGSSSELLAVKKKKQKPKPAVTTPAAVVKEEPLATSERLILDEINLARTNPTEYIKYLEEFKPRFKGLEISFPDGRTLVTNEGIAALNDAITFLREQKPLPPFELRKGLTLAARDHLRDLIMTGKSGHYGSDGSKPEDRASRYGAWRDSVGENIVYDTRSARDTVIGLIIDDGVANRGHRRNIFKLTFHAIGLAMGEPSKTPALTVITFAGDFTDKSATAPSNALRKY